MSTSGSAFGDKSNSINTSSAFGLGSGDGGSSNTSSSLPSTLQTAVAQVAAAQQQQQQQGGVAAAAATPFANLAPNAFAAQQNAAAAATLPPGYAYFYSGQIPGLPGYGSPAGVYPPAAAAMAAVPTTNNQFQHKNSYGSR